MESKRLEKIVIHSNLLIPTSVITPIDKTIEYTEENVTKLIAFWNDNNRKGYKFGIGEKVSFVGDTTQHLIVSNIKKSKNGKRTFIDGIECIYCNT